MKRKENIKLELCVVCEGKTKGTEERGGEENEGKLDEKEIGKGKQRVEVRGQNR